MIRVSLTEIIVLYLIAVLAILFAIWSATEFRRRRREKIARRHLVDCTICGTRFEDLSAEPLPRCPACGSANERDAVRDF